VTLSIASLTYPPCSRRSTRAELTRAQLVIGLIACTDAYRGGDPQILAGRELLGASIDTAPTS